MAVRRIKSKSNFAQPLMHSGGIGRPAVKSMKKNFVYYHNYAVRVTRWRAKLEKRETHRPMMARVTHNNHLPDWHVSCILRFDSGRSIRVSRANK